MKPQAAFIEIATCNPVAAINLFIFYMLFLFTFRNLKKNQTNWYKREEGVKR